MIDEASQVIESIRAGTYSGACAGLSNSDYHSMHHYWSSSDLKFMFDHSPAHFHAQYFPERKKKPQTPSMILGSLIHCLLLTPHDFEKEFAFMPDFPAKKAKTDPTIAEQKEAWRLANAGKTEYTDDLLIDARAMVKSIQKNPLAMDHLSRGTEELAIFWTCKYSGLKFRAKIDKGGPLNFIEVKTAASAKPSKFERQAYDLNYDLSLIHYQEAIRSAFNVTVDPRFIVVESDYPHVCQTFKVSPAFLQSGHDKWLSSVDALSLGLRENKWPGYMVPGDEPELQLPKWAMPKEEKVVEGEEW